MTLDLPTVEVYL